jgi:4-methyl-5(b-hydroxyethyl)-thiazole monophosphate biosynthesis
MRTKNSPRVLVPLVAGFEEIELVAPVDLMRRAGIEVVLASVEPGPEAMGGVAGRGGIVVKPDVALADLDPSTFDLLFLPGGPGVIALREKGEIAPLASRMIGEGKPVAAICAAPLLLADAGLLAGRRYTAHDSVVGELPEALFAERVVEDGPITTSRGPGTAIDLGFAIIRRLKGEAAVEDVAAQIMA